MITLLVLIIIYFSFISLGLPDALLGTGWPVMWAKLGVPLHYAGYISFIISCGTVVSSFVSGVLIRRFGTGLLTALSVTLTAAALFGFSLSPNFIGLCLLAAPLGLGAGSVDAALNNYVALHYKAHHMSWLHCFWGIGAAAGPFIMADVLERGAAWTEGYRAVGFVQLSLAAVLFAALPLWNKVREHSAAACTAPREAPGYRAIFKLRGLKPILVVFFCYCAIETTTGLWGSSFLVTTRGIDPQTAARWTAVYYGGITLGRFISGFLTLRFNNRQMVRAGQCGIAAGFLLLMLPYNSVLLAGFFLIGLGCAPVYPSLLHETPNNFGGTISQSVMGLQMASAYIGSSLSPFIFGRLAALTSFKLFPFYGAALLILHCVLHEAVVRIIARAPHSKNSTAERP